MHFLHFFFGNAALSMVLNPHPITRADPAFHSLARGVLYGGDTTKRGFPKAIPSEVDPPMGKKRKRKVGGKHYEAHSRGRSSPDTLAF